MNDNTPSINHDLAVAEERITWVLENPDISDWLKDTLKSALTADPTTVANDIEMLRHLIVPRSNALVRQALRCIDVAST